MSPSLLIRWQLAGAFAGLALTIACFFTAAAMKRWIRPTRAHRKALAWHRRWARASLAIYAAVALTCLAFHFPFSDPRAALDYGWFLVHPLNGAVGLFLYLGKILVVRRWRLGWKAPGTLLGCALLLSWLLQAATVTPALLHRFGAR